MSQPGRLQSVVAKFRQQLLQHEASAEAAINHAHQHTLTVINAQLSRLYQQIHDKQQAGETVPLSWLYEQNRLQAIKKMIQGQIDHFAALAQTQAGQMQHIGVQLGRQSAMQQLQATVPPGVHYSFGVAHPAAIANLVGAMQNGSPLADMFSGFGQEAADKAAKALITGVTLGHNPRQIAPQVEQALNVPRWRALTVARTEMLRAYRSAALETYRQNSSVCRRWRWTAALNSRTCPACLAMDGKEFDLSVDFGSHPSCRCSPTPVVASWEEVLSGTGIDTSDIPSTSPTFQSGETWLEQQDEATQRAVFGSDKLFELYKSGTPLSDFVQRKHDPDWGGSIQVKPLRELVKP